MLLAQKEYVDTLIQVTREARAADQQDREEMRQRMQAEIHRVEQAVALLTQEIAERKRVTSPTPDMSPDPRPTHREPEARVLALVQAGTPRRRSVLDDLADDDET